MDRLQTELHRLYLPNHPQAQQDGAWAPALIDTDGWVRAIVMELAEPLGWEAVARFWSSVQSELDLPCPAIAISGIDAYQVWFSLAAPVPVAEARNFLESLRQRYLSDVPPGLIRMKPEAPDSTANHDRHTRLIPAIQPETGHWAAFVMPSLGGMFEDERWLESAPNPDAQADVLRQLECIKPEQFKRALAMLGTLDAPSQANDGVEPRIHSIHSIALMTGHGQDPKSFLLAVMNDPNAPLHLRIEAAKILMPYFESPLGKV